MFKLVNLLKAPESYKISRNTLLLLSSQVVSKAIAFSYAIFLGRALGPSDFGLYVYVLTIFGLASQLSDFGFNRFFIRDVARGEANISYYLSNIFTLRFILMLGVVFLAGVIILIFDPQISRSSLAIIALLTILPNGSAMTMEAVFLAIERMVYPAISLVFLSLSVAVLGVVAFSLFGWGIQGIVSAFLIAHVLYFILCGLFLFRERISFQLSFDFPFWRKAVLSSIPYGILAALGLIYFKIDTILLTILRSESETGFYGVAFKFLEALHFIPLSFGLAVFPLMARLHSQDIVRLESLYYSTLKALSLIAFVTFLLIFILAPNLIQILFGQSYAPSVAVLRILSFTIFFMFLHVPGAHLLFATEKFLKQVILLSIFTVSFNIILNLIFIPRYGILAASIITVVSEAVSFFTFFLFIKFTVFRQTQ